ncbi:hypothetical protein HYX14_04850 [Candidatus Woesearchaeota archaeon]|nr:hypothetical protein [Candidatus Woesearchaeota archaeon]
MQETITIERKEYEELKRKADIDTDFLQQLMSSLRDIKEGKVRRVK